MKSITLLGTEEEIERLTEIIKHDSRLPVKLENRTDGTPLSREFLNTRGFNRSEHNESIRWINRSGITIFETDEAYLSPGESPFSFATYVRGDGSFKGGFSIVTEEQLDLLNFALTGNHLEVVKYY